LSAGNFAPLVCLSFAQWDTPIDAGRRAGPNQRTKIEHGEAVAGPVASALSFPTRLHLEDIGAKFGQGEAANPLEGVELFARWHDPSSRLALESRPAAMLDCAPFLDKVTR